MVFYMTWKSIWHFSSHGNNLSDAIENKNTIVSHLSFICIIYLISYFRAWNLVGSDSLLGYLWRWCPLERTGAARTISEGHFRLSNLLFRRTAWSPAIRCLINKMLFLSVCFVSLYLSLYFSLSISVSVSLCVILFLFLSLSHSLSLSVSHSNIFYVFWSICIPCCMTWSNVPLAFYSMKAT